MTGEVTLPCFFYFIPEAKKVLIRKSRICHKKIPLVNTKIRGLDQAFGHTLRTRFQYFQSQLRSIRTKALAGNPQKLTEWLHHTRANNLCKSPLRKPDKFITRIYYLLGASVGCESNIFFYMIL